MIITNSNGVEVAPAVLFSSSETDKSNPTFEDVVQELSQKPWITVLSSDPGNPMVGNFEQEFDDLQVRYAKGRVNTKDFMIYGLGLREFYGGRMRFELQVNHTPPFTEWLERVSASLNRKQIQAVLNPSRTNLVFSVEIRYDSPEDFDKCCRALYISQRMIPV